MPEIVEQTGTSEQDEAKLEFGWNVILWNDPVTPVDTVIELLCRIVQLSLEQATRAAYMIHEHGKGIVATASRNLAEQMKHQLEEFALTVTIEKVA